MARLLRRRPRDAGPEIDTVIEREAGLRTPRDAGRMLGIDSGQVASLVEGGRFPNAFQTADGDWRIPLEDIRRHEARRRRSSAVPQAALVRRRFPHDERPPRPHGWMTPTERRTHIAGLLTARRFVRVASLSAELGVSQMTIRRDLTALEKDGRLTRTYGGAMANDGRTDLILL